MQRKKMWLGPKGFETEVNVPAIDPDFSRHGFSRTAQHVNGGITVQKSMSSHKEYEMTWNKASRQDIETIMAMSEGVWGDELIYWIDPTAADRNLANQMWGTPHVAGVDGVPIFQDQVPTLIENSVDSYTRYPRYSAVYRATGVSESFYVPIPPGCTAWVGVHGAVTGGAGIQVTPLSGLNRLATVNATILPTSGQQLVADSFDFSSGFTGIELSAIETGLFRNYSINPGFESDLSQTLVTGAASTGTPVLSRVAGGRSGSYAARVTYTSNATTTTGGVTQDIPVEEGKTYSFAPYFRANKVSRFQIIVQFRSALGAALSTITGAQYVSTAAPAWGSAQRAILPAAVAPAGAVSARLYLRTVAGTSYSAPVIGDWLEIDDIMVNEGAAIQTFADGNSVGWGWTGAINNSVSFQQPDTLTLGAIVIQVLTTGTLPTPGPFIPPRGHGGCRFAEEPTLTPYSVPLDLEALSAKLYEVGPWE